MSQSLRTDRDPPSEAASSRPDKPLRLPKSPRRRHTRRQAADAHRRRGPQVAGGFVWCDWQSERWAPQRRFGLVVGPGICLLALIIWYWKEAVTVPVAMAVAGGILIVAALFVPFSVVPVQKAWMALASCLGWLNARILLTIVFYLIATPTSLVLRLLRHDPMHRRWRNPHTDSYWVKREDKPFDPEDLRRQF